MLFAKGVLIIVLLYLICFPCFQDQKGLLVFIIHLSFTDDRHNDKKKIVMNEYDSA